MVARIQEQQDRLELVPDEHLAREIQKQPPDVNSMLSAGILNERNQMRQSQQTPPDQPTVAQDVVQAAGGGMGSLPMPMDPNAIPPEMAGGINTQMAMRPDMPPGMPPGMSPGMSPGMPVDPNAMPPQMGPPPGIPPQMAMRPDVMDQGLPGLETPPDMYMNNGGIVGFARGDYVDAPITAEEFIFRNQLRQMESDDRYNVLYGGQTFDDYGQHPNLPQPAGNAMSTAAGGYGFTKGTWDEYGRGSDFSPMNQDAAALRLMRARYGRYTGGGNLAEDLANPETRRGVFETLSPTWASLPGGAAPRRTAEELDLAYAVPEQGVLEQFGPISAAYGAPATATAAAPAAGDGDFRIDLKTGTGEDVGPGAIGKGGWLFDPTDPVDYALMGLGGYGLGVKGLWTGAKVGTKALAKKYPELYKGLASLRETVTGKGPLRYPKGAPVGASAKSAQAAKDLKVANAAAAELKKNKKWTYKTGDRKGELTQAARKTQRRINSLKNKARSPAGQVMTRTEAGKEIAKHRLKPTGWWKTWVGGGAGAGIIALSDMGDEAAVEVRVKPTTEKTDVDTVIKKSSLLDQAREMFNAAAGGKAKEGQSKQRFWEFIMQTGLLASIAPNAKNPAHALAMGGAQSFPDYIENKAADRKLNLDERTAVSNIAVNLTKIKSDEKIARMGALASYREEVGESDLIDEAARRRAGELLQDGTFVFRGKQYTKDNRAELQHDIAKSLRAERIALMRRDLDLPDPVDPATLVTSAEEWGEQGFFDRTPT